MVTIVSRDSEGKGIPSIVSADLGAMHIEISTSRAHICVPTAQEHRQHQRLSHRMERERDRDRERERNVSRYVNVICDPLARFASIQDGHVIEDMRAFVDDPRIYTLLSIIGSETPISSMFFRVICLPSIMHHMTHSLGQSANRFMHITYDPICAATCPHSARDTIIQDGSLSICLRDPSTVISISRASVIEHVHVITSHCIESECARFIYDNIMATALDSDHQVCKIDMAENLTVWLIGTDYYISPLPLSNSEYEQYLAPRVRLRMTSRVTDDILCAQPKRSTARGSSGQEIAARLVQKRECPSAAASTSTSTRTLLREMLNNDD